MKAVFIMEMPDYCEECPLEMDVEDAQGNVWVWNGNICRGCGKRNADMFQKPDWCPLVPMPEHIPVQGAEAVSSPSLSGRIYEGLKEAAAMGWNNCLDAIAGSPASSN